MQRGDRGAVPLLGRCPRVLNTLADNALFEGFLAELAPLDASIVADAADDLGLCPGNDSHAASSVSPPAAPYVEGSRVASSARENVPPLPAASASAVALELPEDEDGKPAADGPSSWESGLWEEPADDDTDGLEFADFASTPGADNDPGPGEPEFGVGEALAAKSERLDSESEDPDLDLEALLQLPANEPEEEQPADPELELELSPIEDDVDEPEFEGVAGTPEPGETSAEVEGTVEPAGSDSGFDLESLLTDVDVEPDTVAEPLEVGEPAASADDRSLRNPLRRHPGRLTEEAPERC